MAMRGPLAGERGVGAWPRSHQKLLQRVQSQQGESQVSVPGVLPGFCKYRFMVFSQAFPVRSALTAPTQREGRPGLGCPHVCPAPPSSSDNPVIDVDLAVLGQGELDTAGVQAPR